MTDLHLHLDGSLPVKLLEELAHEQRVPLPEPLGPALQAPEDCGSLDEYLRCFDLPLALLQSAWALEKAAYALCRELGEEGLTYAEIRFAPQLHGQKGLTQRQAVQAVCRGVRASGFPAQVILCAMRGGEDPINRETAALAASFLGQGVCACDLAGAEALYPTELYRGVFQYARSLGVPYTIHAGEAAGPESIWAALEMGASRIGHGVRAREDPALVRELAARQVPLELCFTSNLQTKAVKGPGDFPLREYLSQGLCCTVNTDNRTVSGTTLREEYRRLGLTPGEEAVLEENARKARFVKEG